MKLVSLVGALALALAAGGCGDKGKDDDKAAAGEGGQAAGGAPALSLETLGLRAAVPAGTKVNDSFAGDGVMLQGPDLVVTIAEATPTRPETLEEAKKDLGMYKPTNVEVEELADGWMLTFENEGTAGTNYFVQVRREIGGTVYWCETTASTPAQAATAAATCKSLVE